MKNKRLGIGLSYALVAMILVGIQPIIVIGRNEAIDPYFFTGITCLYQAFLFIPITLIHRKKRKNQLEKDPIKYEINNSLLNDWKKKKNINFLIYIGISFSISQVLYFTGLDMAGAIN
ncbi:MAG: EamA family transporter [Candidatus Lokiarchaeota archaeon]|nr:EamA family transporter [Candidatus Lokiarchaeota archaeon]